MPVTDSEKTAQIFAAMDADKSGKLDEAEQLVLVERMVRASTLHVGHPVTQVICRVTWVT